MKSKIQNKILLFVIPSLSPGGAEHQLINQINFLIENGTSNIKLIILSSEYEHLLNKLLLKKEHIYLLNDNSSSTINAGLFKNLFYLIKHLSKVIQKNKITDVIAILPMAHFVCRLVNALHVISFKRQFSLNVYYRDVYYQASPLNTLFKKFFNSINSAFAFLFDSRTLFISNAVYEDIKKNIFIRNPLILPNSLPVRNITECAGLAYLSNKAILPNSKYLILIPGRLHHKKGHLFFIETFKDFVAKENISPEDILVIIAGEGSLRSEIENKIKSLNLNNFFYLNGYTENDLLLSLYKCVDLVVIPSIHEGFGNVAIEGLMQQSLMLVSDTGGLGEIIKDGVNGFKFTNLDNWSLLTKLTYLYKNRKQNLIDKNILYNDFLNNYTVEKQMTKIWNFCKL